MRLERLNVNDLEIGKTYLFHDSVFDDWAIGTIIRIYKGDVVIEKITDFDTCCVFSFHFNNLNEMMLDEVFTIPDEMM